MTPTPGTIRGGGGPGSIAGSSVVTPIPIPRSAKGKERESSLRDSAGGSGSGQKEGGGKERDDRECVLEEFRRFGRWDGWG